MNPALNAGMSTRASQAGYLLEVPLLLMATAIILALLWPLISGMARPLALSLGILIYAAGLYYMILTPGWQPEGSGGRQPPWRRILLFGMVILSALGGLWYVWLG